MSRTPVILSPHAEVAERVLLPGDPGRALRLAQVLTSGPRMLNHQRGLWGYTGTAADGHLLTVQSTGLGGPGVAAVAEELAGLGARRLVRVGTARSLAPRVAAGELVVASAAVCGDGTSRALGAGPQVEPDPTLTRALTAAGDRTARTGTVVSTDLYYAPAREEGGDDALVADLGTAALFAVGALRGVAVAAVLLVTGAADEPGRQLGGEALHAAETRLGRVAFAALGS